MSWRATVTAADVVDGMAERRGHELDVRAPLPGDEAVDEHEQADGHDHDRDHRVLHRPDDRDLHDAAEANAIASVAKNAAQ